jgi:hypothetical protein
VSEWHWNNTRLSIFWSLKETITGIQRNKNQWNLKTSNVVSCFLYTFNLRNSAVFEEHSNYISRIQNSPIDINVCIPILTAALGGLVVSVLATGPTGYSVAGSSPTEGGGILWVIWGPMSYSMSDPSHPWDSPASLPDGSSCWIRLIRNGVVAAG